MDHPGIVLQEMLTAQDMSRKELAVRTGVTEKHICTVLNGDHGISAAFARKLGYVFEDAKYWLNLQASYDADQARIKEENNISSDEVAILKPLKDIMAYLILRGYMHNDCGDADKVMQLRELLNISNLADIPKVTYNAAYRAQLTKNVKVDPYVLFVWQRLCEKETETANPETPLDTERLRRKLPEIKALMSDEINVVLLELHRIFAECGIVFRVVKNFRGAPVQGFIKLTGDGRLILCLTIRGQRADRFWFTLFHEIAHILHGDYVQRFVDFDSVQTEAENRADEFARDFLISPTSYQTFLRTTGSITWGAIERLANENCVPAFVVLGRLQNDQILDWSDFSSHVVQYQWA